MQKAGEPNDCGGHPMKAKQDDPRCCAACGIGLALLATPAARLFFRRRVRKNSRPGSRTESKPLHAMAPTSVAKLRVAPVRRGLRTSRGQYQRGTPTTARTALVNNRHAPDLVALHRVTTVLERRIWRHGHHRLRHAVLGGELERISAFRHGATRDIAIGNDTDEFPPISVLDDGNVAAVVLGHQLRDILQIRVRRATDDVVGHEFAHLHHSLQHLKGRFHLLGNEPARDAIPGVASRITLHVVRLGVDDQRRSATGEDRIASGRERNMGVDHDRLDHAVGRDREIAHVAGVRSLRILQPMLLAKQTASFAACTRAEKYRSRHTP